MIIAYNRNTSGVFAVSGRLEDRRRGDYDGRGAGPGGGCPRDRRHQRNSGGGAVVFISGGFIPGAFIPVCFSGFRVLRVLSVFAEGCGFTFRRLFYCCLYFRCFTAARLLL